MPANGVTGLPYGTLFGRPVIPCEQCKALGTVGDILLVDPKDYIGIEKGRITSDSSIHVQFLYDEQLLRFRYRFNGAPYTQNKVASYAKSTWYMSPYVALATRA
jgi:HK97 family phage major capsid protein